MDIRMFRSLALFAVFTVAATCAGCAYSDNDSHNTVVELNDVAEIYGKVLHNWVGTEKVPINVSIEAKAPSSEDIKQFSDCMNQDKQGAARWLPAKPISDLTSVIGKLSYVRLVHTEEWEAEDPGNLIAQGKSVESAVENGFEHGLFTMSAITFDTTHETAALTYSFVCGMLCGSGASVIYRKTQSGWVQGPKECAGWIS